MAAGLRRDLWRSLGLAASVGVGTAIAALVLAISSGAGRALERWFPAGDRTLTVLAPRFKLGALSPRLDDDAVARLRALPLVESVTPRLLLRAPALTVYRGLFFGQQLNLAIEIAAEGVPAAAVAEGLFAGERFAWEGHGVLPACISDGLLAIYNDTFAPSRGLPHLDARLLQGFELPVTVGASLLGSAGGSAGGSADGSAEALTVRIVCVSPRALLAGLTLPLEAVKALNARHGQGDGARSSLSLLSLLSSVEVVAQTSRALPALAAAIDAAGLRVEQRTQGLPLRIGRGVQAATWALLAVAIVALALAMALVAQGFAWSIRARAPELRLLRALGATDAFWWRQLSLEATAIGLGGGLFGLLLARLAGLALGPALPLPQLLAFSLASWLVPLVLALAAALGGAAVALGWALRGGGAGQ